MENETLGPEDDDYVNFELWTNCEEEVNQGWVIPPVVDEPWAPEPTPGTMAGDLAGIDVPFREHHTPSTMQTGINAPLDAPHNRASGFNEQYRLRHSSLTDNILDVNTPYVGDRPLTGAVAIWSLDTKIETKNSLDVGNSGYDSKTDIEQFLGDFEASKQPSVASMFWQGTGMITETVAPPAIKSVMSLSEASHTPSWYPDPLPCSVPGCSQTFTGDHRRGNRNRHVHRKHKREVKYNCGKPRCTKTYVRSDARLKHWRNKHGHP